MHVIELTKPNEADEPVSLTEAYHQLRIDADPEVPNDYAGEALVKLQLSGARAYCEAYAGISFAYKRYKLTLDCFPRDRYSRPCAPIVLPFGPIVNIVSFGYGEQDLNPDYYLVQDSNTIYPKLTWPFVNYDDQRKIEIIYDAGYGNNSNTRQCPDLAKIAILFTLGHLDANRETVTDKQLYEIPLGARNQLDLLRDRTGLA